MKSIFRNIIAGLSFVCLFTGVAEAGNLVSGRITYLHWIGSQLYIEARRDAVVAVCPQPLAPYYGARFLLPNDTKLVATVLQAKAFNLLTNLYWNDSCLVVGLDVFQ